MLPTCTTELGATKAPEASGETSREETTVRINNVRNNGTPGINTSSGHKRRPKVRVAPSLVSSRVKQKATTVTQHRRDHVSQLSSSVEGNPADVPSSQPIRSESERMQITTGTVSISDLHTNICSQNIATSEGSQESNERRELGAGDPAKDGEEKNATPETTKDTHDAPTTSNAGPLGNNSLSKRLIDTQFLGVNGLPSVTASAEVKRRPRIHVTPNLVSRRNGQRTNISGQRQNEATPELTNKKVLGANGLPSVTASEVKRRPKIHVTPNLVIRSGQKTNISHQRPHISEPSSTTTKETVRHNSIPCDKVNEQEPKQFTVATSASLRRVEVTPKLSQASITTTSKSTEHRVDNSLDINGSSKKNSHTVDGKSLESSERQEVEKPDTLATSNLCKSVTASPAIKTLSSESQAWKGVKGPTNLPILGNSKRRSKVRAVPSREQELIMLNLDVHDTSVTPTPLTSKNSFSITSGQNNSIDKSVEVCKEGDIVSKSPAPYTTDNRTAEKTQKAAERKEPKSKKRKSDTDITEPKETKKSKPEKHLFRTRKGEYKKKIESEGLEHDNMKIYDFIFWNPTDNPMAGRKKQCRKKPCVSTKKDSQPEGSGEGQNKTPNTVSFPPTLNQNEKETESMDDDQQSSETAFAPRVKIGPDGQLMIDYDSLNIKTTANRKRDKIMATTAVTEEHNDASHKSLYRKKRSRHREWTPDENVLFYKALSTVGTDFSMMEALVTSRSRSELKSKFKREEKLNKDMVERSLQDSSMHLMSNFSEESGITKTSHPIS